MNDVLKSRFEFLNRVKLSALLLQNNRESSHLGEVVLVQSEIDNLLEDLYSRCGDMISREEYERAKRGFSDFLSLIDSLLSRVKDEAM